MILSHRHRFIFFCNGRTGTTSLESALAHLQEGAEHDIGMPGVFVAKHIPPMLLRERLTPEVWSSYFKFVFVRNPWDWFVSQWMHNRTPTSGSAWSTRIQALVRGISGRVAAPSRFSASQVESLFRTLWYFRGLETADGLYQSNYVYDQNGNELVNFVGRYESLKSDVTEIALRIGIPIRLPFLNRSQRFHYRRHFSEVSRQRVAELWKRDICNFGYSFE